MPFGLAIIGGDSGGSWGGTGATVVPGASTGTWSTGSGDSGGGGTVSSYSYSAPAPSYAPAVFNSRGPFGEGVYTPLDYPPLRFLGEGNGLFDVLGNPVAPRAQVSKADQMIALALIAVILLKG